MPRLFPVFYSIIASTLAGLSVVVALVAGVTGAIALVACAAGGALLAAPVTWIVARRMDP